MGKSADAPQSPDYERLIPLQTQANKDVFNTMLNASRPNTSDPYGSSTWTKTPIPGSEEVAWSQQTRLSPEQQQLYDANVGSQLQQADLLKGLGGRVGDATAQPLDVSGAPNLTGGVSPSTFRDPNFARGLADPRAISQEGADAAYSMATRYLKPQQEEQTRLAEGRLAEQGFVPGTPAYNQAMGEIRKTQEMSLADARDRALLAGHTMGGDWFARDVQGRGLQRAETLDANAVSDRLFGQQKEAGEFGNKSRSQAISELLALRQYPLNELNALRSGTQVQTPNLTGQYSVPNLQAPDTVGAANQNYQNQLGVYNADVSSGNATTGMLGSLATAAAMYF